MEVGSLRLARSPQAHECRSNVGARVPNASETRASSEARWLTAPRWMQTATGRIGSRHGCRPPRDPALGIDPFEVPDQQQAEIGARRQARSPARRRVERAALRLDEVVERVIIHRGMPQIPSAQGPRGGSRPAKRCMASRSYTHDEYGRCRSSCRVRNRVVLLGVTCRICDVRWAIGVAVHSSAEIYAELPTNREGAGVPGV